MVIQRLQTLLLVIAIVLGVVFYFVPFGYESLVDGATMQSVVSPLKAIDFIGLIVPVSVALLLMVVAIFMFKKPAPQKLFVVLSALATAAAAGVVIYILSAGAVDTDSAVSTRTIWGHKVQSILFPNLQQSNCRLHPAGLAGLMIVSKSL